MTQEEKKKYGRKFLSMTKLYKMIYGFTEKNPKVDMSAVAKFLEYIDKHKNN
jgi:hypothetical protein